MDRPFALVLQPSPRAAKYIYATTFRGAVNARSACTTSQDVLSLVTAAENLRIIDRVCSRTVGDRESAIESDCGWEWGLCDSVRFFCACASECVSLSVSDCVTECLRIGGTFPALLERHHAGPPTNQLIRASSRRRDVLERWWQRGTMACHENGGWLFFVRDRCTAAWRRRRVAQQSAETSRECAAATDWRDNHHGGSIRVRACHLVAAATIGAAPPCGFRLASAGDGSSLGK